MASPCWAPFARMAAMRFHADLHVHSKYSRATSRDLDLEHVAAWAARKGIAVVGTGDFTHPAWRTELKDKLLPAEPGLFRLRPELEQAIVRQLPPACQAPVRFMLSVEISTIYKKGEKTRKIHHLIYAPDFATADRISERLARIGNIASDGRPILGLDFARSLGNHAHVEPRRLFHSSAHLDAMVRRARLPIGVRFHQRVLWRPCRSHLCRRDRIVIRSANELAAVDAGPLSAGVEFRRPFAGKTRPRGHDVLIATSTISPSARRWKPGGLRRHGRVLSRGGQVPLDGHRKCGVRFSRRETVAQGGRCPVCGGAMTIGVQHRIETLADRSETEATPPPTAGEVSNLVPLPECIGEIADTGPASKTVERGYEPNVGQARLGAFHSASGAARGYCTRKFFAGRRGDRTASRRQRHSRRRL